MLRLSLAMLATLCLAAPAAAQEQDEAMQAPGQSMARMELIVPRKSVRPGETIPIGVKFTMAPEWHIYWKNPGDSGQSPDFRWSLPGGGAARMMRGSEWTTTEPQYPVPIRWEDAGGLVGYGYTGSVIFPAELKVPPSATPGQTVEVGVSAQYLVCKDVCLNEWGSASVELLVTTDSGEEDDSATMRVLESARKALPAARKDGVKVESTEDGAMVEVPVPPGAKNVNFFPNPPQGLVVEDIEVTTQGQTARATFRVRKMAGATVQERDFEAVVGYDTNEGRRGVSLRVPVPEGARQ